MLKLEEITKDAKITGLVPDEVVKVVNVEDIRHGLNQKDKFVLAVMVDGDSAESVNYAPCHSPRSQTG